MTTQNITTPQSSHRLWDETIQAYGYLIIGSSLVIGGALGSYLIAAQRGIPAYELKEGINIFAVFFIMAQALERLLEPITHFLPGQDKPSEGENCEAIAADLRRQRSTLIWALASFLGMLSSAYLGVFILRAIGVTSAPLWIDITVTGLAVGAGTKPLHDLISRIEKAKNS